MCVCVHMVVSMYAVCQLPHVCVQESVVIVSGRVVSSCAVSLSLPLMRPPTPPSASSAVGGAVSKQLCKVKWKCQHRRLPYKALHVESFKVQTYSTPRASLLDRAHVLYLHKIHTYICEMSVQLFLNPQVWSLLFMQWSR